jgi:GT2 family glycosyltransferase
MTTPEVTVVIPTRDRWRLVASHALRAALLQEDVDHEVIVVDDGSSDETPTRLAALDEARVRVVRHDTPGGVAHARNAGLREARGAWIAFLDDDDYWAPHKLRRQLDAARSSDADFVYSGVLAVDDDGSVLFEFETPPPEQLRFDVIEKCVIAAGPSNVLVRTALLRELGGFDEQLLNMEDWDLWIRLASAGKADVVPENLVAYVEHAGGKSLTTPRVAYDRLRYLDEKHRGLRAELGREVDQVAFAHYVAWLQLRSRRHASAAGVYVRSAIRNRRPQDALLAVKFGVRALLPVRRRLRAASDRGRVPEPSWLGLYR